MPFKNKIRLPFYLRQPQFPSERNVFRKSDGSVKVLSNVIRKTYQGLTDMMDENLHQRLRIALAHDTVTITNANYLYDIVEDGDYQIGWIDFIDFPLAPATFQVQITPFNVSNDNCATCEEATQLNLSDDTFPGSLEEGEEYTISVYDNDTICCFPPDASITTFNTDYLDSATIDSETGIITVVVKDPVADSGPGMNLLTYRVTCPDGSYDEADVFGEVTGSVEACTPPSDLVYSHIPETEISTESDQVSWTGTGDFEWNLYNCGDLGTPISSGTTSGNVATFLSLDVGSCYHFSIRKVCESSNSEFISIDFETPAPESNCGRFDVTANDGTLGGEIYSFSYMNCSGTLVPNHVVNLDTKSVCMLTDSMNVPIYFVASNVAVTYSYDEPC